MDGTRHPIRLAMVGAGWAVGRIWAPMLAGHPGYRVAAVADPSPDALRHAVSLFEGARPAATVDELPSGEVDLAVVATPNHLHGPVAAGLLRRGIPVFVEKPVCLRAAEAAEIADAERTGGARLLAGTAAWHRADVKALRALGGELGELRSMELSWVRASGVPARGSWFTDRSRAGGGALVDLGWHLITVGLRMLGWPAVHDVVAAVSGDFIDGGASTASWHEGADAAGDPVDVEDTARAVFRTAGDVLCSLTTAWASHAETDYTRIALEGSAGRAELCCTFGLSPHRVPRSRLRVWRAGRTEEVGLPAEPVGAEYRTQLELFPALLGDPGRSGAAVREATRIVDLVERIYRSAGVVTAARPFGPPHGDRNEEQPGAWPPRGPGATTTNPGEVIEGVVQ
jgi:oxidoreductase